jgi:hypothetical protein
MRKQPSSGGQRLDLDREILAPLLAGLRSFVDFDPADLLAVLASAATAPGHRLAAVLGEQFNLAGVGPVSRTEVLLFALRRGGRFGEADELARDLDQLRRRAVSWDEEAAANAATAQESGREFCPADLLGEWLVEDRRNLEDLASACLKRLRLVAASRTNSAKTASPKGRPGRPATSTALGKFSDARRRRKTPLTWKEIAAEWNAKHTEITTSSKVRGAYRRWQKRQEK